MWEKLIAYEKSNPLELQPAALQERVRFTYEQALLCLNKYADVWIEIVEYNIENNFIKEAEEYYKKSILLNPSSSLLHFSYCFFLEERNLVDRAEEVYNLLLQNNPSTLAYIQKMRFKKRTKVINLFHFFVFFFYIFLFIFI